TVASAGIALFAAGILLMLPSFVEWVRTAHITWHWSYFAAGGTLILVGLQLSIWFVLLTMVHDLADRPSQIRHGSRLDWRHAAPRPSAPLESRRHGRRVAARVPRVSRRRLAASLGSADAHPGVGGRLGRARGGPDGEREHRRTPDPGCAHVC